MNVEEIIRKYLEDNGSSGLYYAENDQIQCGCSIDDLIPCRGDIGNCQSVEKPEQNKKELKK